MYVIVVVSDGVEVVVELLPELLLSVLLLLDVELVVLLFVVVLFVVVLFVVLFCELLFVDVLLVVVFPDVLFVVLFEEFEVWLLLEEDDITLAPSSPACCSLEVVSFLSAEVLESLLKDELFKLLLELLESLPLGAKRTILIQISTTAKTAAMIYSHRLLFTFGFSIVCFSSKEVIQ